MNLKRLIILLSVISVLLYGPCVIASPSNDQIKLAKNAVIRWMCWEDYWEGRTFIPGEKISVTIKFDGDKFDALANGKLSSGDGLIFTYYWGRVTNANSYVIMREEYTTFSDGSGQEGTKFDKRKKLFEQRQVHKDNIIMPYDCTPIYEPLSPKKAQMITTIINTIKKAEFLQKEQDGQTPAPTEIQLLIADFNVDYPYTYVVVEPDEKVYHIALHDFGDYDSDEYERSGEYPWNTEPRTSGAVIRKVREHGILKKIFLKH